MMLSLMCLATAIFFEARGEDFQGKLAVGQVIENRVDSPYFKNDVCEVINRKHQFSFKNDGLSDNPYDYLDNSQEIKAWLQSIVAADKVLNGEVELVPTSVYYHNTSVTPYWSKKFKLDGQIGNHIFYSR